MYMAGAFLSQRWRSVTSPDPSVIRVKIRAEMKEICVSYSGTKTRSDDMFHQCLRVAERNNASEQMGILALGEIYSFVGIIVDKE